MTARNNMKVGTFGTQGQARWMRKATFFFLSVAALSATTSAARAQVARVASVQRTVEIRTGNGPWRKVGAGASLGINSSLRTGKRSKADMKFADGSLLRLGQLSSIVIQSAKGVRLTGGQVLYSALRPGRILAGSGSAEIKGSVGTVSFDPATDNMSVTSFAGEVDVTSGNGTTVSLAPGTEVTAGLNGTMSPVQAAAPFSFAGGSLVPELAGEPESAPYAGSAANVEARAAPEQVAVEQTLPQANPIVAGNLPGAGAGVVFPTDPPEEPESPQPFPTAFPTLPPNALRGSLLSMGATRPSQQIRIAQAPASPVSPTIPAADAIGNIGNIGDAVAPDVAINDLAVFDLDTRRAIEHLNEVERSRGRSSGAEGALITAVSDGGVVAYGARLRGFGTRGKFYYEGTLLPLRVRTGGADGGTRDLSSIANAFVTYREERGEVQIGRQRFLSGPTQSSLFGSLVRQGGRETMDAIRIQPKLDDGLFLEAAYIYDAFPRNLPFQISGPQRAAYGRFALRRPQLNLGLNLFKYLSEPSASKMGATVDFAIPLKSDVLELYGEVGRDSFGRRLTTAGLSFPGLFEKTDIDAFLEYAKLRPNGGVAAPPREVTLRLYRKFGESVNTVAALSHFRGSGWNFTLGVSIGARVGRSGSR
jgi:hypothetical protein